ncbi:MAG: diaminopimelate epimerase [Holosporales bacterium]|jgi:diaminopimelate epimerase|nr:diaminopimelate epimerase [Holosporales bacterium]
MIINHELFIKFTKAETNGNDFIIIEDIPLSMQDIKKISDRRYGIGADQIIIYKRISQNFYDVKFFNSDGSEADMCGNGLSALTKFLGFENKFVVKGQKYIGKVEQNGIVNITVPLPTEILCDKILCNKRCKIINVGNKHIVLLEVAPMSESEQTNTPTTFFSHITQYLHFLDSKEKNDVLAEYNIHFVNFIKNGVIEIDSYERGAGHTLSCGSGAIACAFAYGNPNGETVVQQKGGKSYVKFLKNTEAVLKTKPNIVFCGEITL